MIVCQNNGVIDESTMVTPFSGIYLMIFDDIPFLPFPGSNGPHSRSW